MGHMVGRGVGPVAAAAASEAAVVVGASAPAALAVAVAADGIPTAQISRTCFDALLTGIANGTRPSLVSEEVWGPFWAMKTESEAMPIWSYATHILVHSTRTMVTNFKECLKSVPSKLLKEAKKYQEKKKTAMGKQRADLNSSPADDAVRSAVRGRLSRMVSYANPLPGLPLAPYVVCARPLPLT